MSVSEGRTTGGAGQMFAWVGAWLAVTAMLVLAPFFLASGLMAPLWGVVVVVVMWAALSALAIVLLVKRRPLWVLPLPVLAVGFWWLFLSLGGKFLGWTA
jgi:hypothetical protein